MHADQWAQNGKLTFGVSTGRLHLASARARAPVLEIILERHIFSLRRREDVWMLRIAEPRGTKSDLRGFYHKRAAKSELKSRHKFRLN